MSEWNERELSPDLQRVAEQLRAARRQPTALELDEIKLNAERRASRRIARRPAAGALRARLASVLLALVLVAGGGGAVIAASSGSNGKGNGAARSQYCPPKSPGAGKPKNPPPGNACGQPNRGNPSPGPGR